MATLLTLSSTPTPASSSSELEASADEAEEKEEMESKQRPSAAATQQPPPLVRDLRRRLRDRHSSAKFRERQHLRVDELRAQIVYFKRENGALELRIQ